MIRLIAVGAILVSTSCANIISPAQGEIWALNVDHEITWDTEGLVAPLQVQLGPGDSNNASSSITTVARKFSSDLFMYRMKLTRNSIRPKHRKVGMAANDEYPTTSKLSDYHNR